MTQTFDEKTLQEAEQKRGDAERQRAAESQREWRRWYSPLEPDCPWHSVLTI